MSTYHPQSGFSLVETLVAITIVLIVIVGPMTIMSTASNSTSFSSEQVVAFFLAQEGAELAQKARDDLVLDRFTGGPNDWSDFVDDTGGPYADCYQAAGCGLEISEAADGAIEAPIDCATAGACNLYFDDSNSNVRSRYTHDNSFTSTPYERTIQFDVVGNGVRVVSQVQWFSGISRNAQTVEVETFLFNVYAP